MWFKTCLKYISMCGPSKTAVSLQTNVGVMLTQHRRRWANIKPTLVQRLVCAGLERNNLIVYKEPTTLHNAYHNQLVSYKHKQLYQPC